MMPRRWVQLLPPEPCRQPAQASAHVPQAYEEALELRERTLGAAHPDTATTMENLGCLLLDLVRCCWTWAGVGSEAPAPVKP